MFGKKKNESKIEVASKFYEEMNKAKELMEKKVLNQTLILGENKKEWIGVNVTEEGKIRIELGFEKEGVDNIDLIPEKAQALITQIQNRLE